jgi:hypothetical protein
VLELWGHWPGLMPWVECATSPRLLEDVARKFSCLQWRQIAWL